MATNHDKKMFKKLMFLFIWLFNTTLTVKVRVSPHSCERLIKEGSFDILEIIVAGASLIYKINLNKNWLIWTEEDIFVYMLIPY